MGLGRDGVTVCMSLVNELFCAECTDVCADQEVGFVLVEGLEGVAMFVDGSSPGWQWGIECCYRNVC